MKAGWRSEVMKILEEKTEPSCLSLCTKKITNDINVTTITDIDARKGLGGITLNITALLQSSAIEELHQKLDPSRNLKGIVPITFRLLCLPDLANPYSRQDSQWTWQFSKDQKTEWHKIADHFKYSYEDVLDPFLLSLNSLEAIENYLESCPRIKNFNWESYICLLILLERKSLLERITQDVRACKIQGKPLTAFSNALLETPIDRMNPEATSLMKDMPC